MTNTKRVIVLLLAGGLCGGLSGGLVARQRNAHDNKDLALYCPKEVTVAVEGTSLIPVEIKRRGFSGQVILNFLQFPDGLTIAEQDRSIAEDKTKATFTLKASYMAKVGDGMGKITATASNLRAEQTVRVHVIPKK